MFHRIIKHLAVLIALGAEISSSHVVAGAPMRCAPATFVSRDPSIRNVVVPGDIHQQPGDRVILVNRQAETTTVFLGDAARFKRSVTVKDCYGNAERSHIRVIGNIDMGDWTIDGNGGFITLTPLGSVWMLGPVR